MDRIGQLDMITRHYYIFHLSVHVHSLTPRRSLIWTKPTHERAVRELADGLGTLGTYLLP